MTKQRDWGIMACTFLIGSGIALAMAVFQEQLVWAVAANLLTLGFALCLHFHHETRIEGIAQVCDGLKILVLTQLKKAPRKPTRSELKDAIITFPKLRGDR